MFHIERFGSLLESKMYVKGAFLAKVYKSF